MRVVDEDVDAAPARGRLRDHALDVGPPADVGTDCERFAAGVTDLLRGAFAAMRLQLRDADARALAREEGRDAAADALAGAGDDRDLPGDAHAVSLHTVTGATRRRTTPGSFLPQQRVSRVRPER